MSSTAQPTFPNGVWPTMITPFTADNKIDYPALEKMIDWYMQRQVDGLFAVCQSSEMYLLTLDERIQLAKFVREQTPSHIPVIASGHISDSLTEQIKEINKIAETGIDTMILVTNNLAQKDESDDIWKQNMETLLGQIPDSLPLGLYECPHPYKRLLSPDLLQWVSSTNRFYFFKDTSCDDRIIQHRLKTLKGTRMKLYNANSATLFATLTMGAAGYTGVMANFHPELYIKGIKLLEISSKKAEELFQFLSLASVIERQFYPVNAKYHLQLEGLPIQLYSRVKDHREFSSSQRLEVEHLRAVAKRMINV